MFSTSWFSCKKCGTGLLRYVSFHDSLSCPTLTAVEMLQRSAQEAIASLLVEKWDQQLQQHTHLDEIINPVYLWLCKKAVLSSTQFIKVVVYYYFVL